MLGLIVIGLALQGTQPVGGEAREAGFPPFPRFDGRSQDYFAWFAERTTAGEELERNGAPLYLELFGQMGIPEEQLAERLGFAGFRLSRKPNTVVVPAGWDPAEHADWERSYERSREGLAAYARAAERPFVLYPFFFDERTKPEERLLYHALTPYLPYMRVYGTCLSDMAWRAPGGRVSAERLLEAARTNLRAARQLERIPWMRTRLAGSGLRVLVYEDLRYALHQGVMSAGDVTAALRMLEQEDEAPRPMRYHLAGEAATYYDMILGGMDASRPQLGRDHIRNALSALRGGQIDGPASAAHLREYLVEGALFAERPFTPQTRSFATNLHASGAGLNMLTKMVFPDYARLYFLDRRVRAERAGVRLLLWLHAYKHEHGRWPAKLEELPSGSREFQMDPFGDGAFVYRLEGGEPLVYSRAADGEDDGGVHDWHWGDYWKARDYVLWPVPARGAE